MGFKLQYTGGDCSAVGLTIYYNRNGIISDISANFSPFTFGSKTGSNPLPVSLLGFNAELENSDNGASLELSGLYPNPVKDEFYVLVKAIENTIAKIFITDVSGKLIYQKQIVLQSGENLITLNASNYAPGFYILTIGDKSNRVSRKFVK
ncbi:MAG: T9SS type A sorting domain-containing protein [Bacteroidales bacterium]|nr:T9SS type A sorting domain-containing protein [Bacteroidales bacterium]MDY0143225.1 T9SS type A sorting domain-containing protein [Bacteroidales bacterium]